MNILHVLSQVEVTGAETYAVTLADEQVRQGHRVWIVSDTLRTPTLATYLPQPIANRRHWQRARNIARLRQLIDQLNIDVLNAHSRAASWVGYFARLGTRVPLVSTVHGRQHLHASTRRLDVYGDRVIAVCDNLRTHLIEEVNVAARKIVVIPNAFAFDDKLAVAHKPAGAPAVTLALVGRTTGWKGEITGQLIVRTLPGLLAQFPHLRVQVLGGPASDFSPAVTGAIDALNAQYGPRIGCPGFVADLPVRLAAADAVVASGRVAIDALRLGKPLLALGESLYHGLVTAQNLAEATASNFGDIVPTLPVPPPDYNRIGQDLARTLADPPTDFSARTWVEQHYALRRVADAVLEQYLSARFKQQHPRHVPVLMYHKVPDEPSQSRHRIFVPKAQFARHLAFLHRRGFTPITFAEYDAWKRHPETTSAPFPQKPIFLTFDDGYLDNYVNAFPLLRQYGFRATVFALGEAAHRNNFWDVRQGEPSEPLMDAAQRREMLAYGIEFGAHTLNHARLTELPEAEARREIAESKARLEAALGAPVLAFAYPYGALNADVKRWTAEAGYRYAVAIDQGGLHLEDDPLEIFRAYIFPEDGPTQLRKKTASWYRRYFQQKRGR